MQSELNNAVNVMIKLGINLEYGPLTLTNLANYCITRNNLDRKYQVDCDDANIRYSEIFSSFATARDKWVSLFYALKSKELKLELKEKTKE